MEPQHRPPAGGRRRPPTAGRRGARVAGHGRFADKIVTMRRDIAFFVIYMIIIRLIEDDPAVGKETPWPTNSPHSSTRSRPGPGLPTHCTATTGASTAATMP